MRAAAKLNGVVTAGNSRGLSCAKRLLKKKVPDPKHAIAQVVFGVAMITALLAIAGVSVEGTRSVHFDQNAEEELPREVQVYR